MVNVVIDSPKNIQIATNTVTPVTVKNYTTNNVGSPANVIVGRKRTVQVSSNATAGVIDSTTPVTIKNYNNITSLGRLDKLLDVDASNEYTGSTLVYDGDTDKYVVKKLDIADITGTIDGGVF